MFSTPNDFAIQNGKLVKPNDQGYSFVFFFTPDCLYCDDVKPAFNYLSKMIRGVNFSYMNVFQNNGQLIEMSKWTETPIKEVPLLILFALGNQIARFFQDEDNPQNNIHKMQEFLIANTSQQAPRIGGGSRSGPDPSQGGDSNIPAFGIPGNFATRKVCKLYNNAYATK